MLIEILSLIVIIIGAILMGIAPSSKTMNYFPVVMVFAIICLLNVSLYALTEVQSKQRKYLKSCDVSDI